MRRQFIHLLLMLTTLTCYASSAEPPTLRLQSVENFYNRGEGEVCCTVKLHVRAAQGSTFAVVDSSVPASTPLVGVDATGRILLGKFRCVESCMEDCRSLVFDFYTRPVGGWIEFDTFLLLRLTSTDFVVRSPAIDPRRMSTLRTLNRSFFLTPLPEESAEPGSFLLRVDYEMSPLIRSITFCDASGKPCKSRVLNATYNDEDGLTSTTYLLEADDQSPIHLQLRLHHPPSSCKVPVRMRIYPGIITDPGT